MARAERPTCVHCKFFYVTWEAPSPRGCRAFGFKSEQYPSSVVYEVSGAECRLYENKPDSQKRPRKRPTQTR